MSFGIKMSDLGFFEVVGFVFDVLGRICGGVDQVVMVVVDQRKKERRSEVEHSHI